MEESPKPITHFKIFGERCSGTYLLEDSIMKNFDIIYWHQKKYGHKHFLGFEDLSDSDNTLFICTVRDPIKWLNSLYRTPHHLSKEICDSPENFLTYEVHSWHYNCPRMRKYSKPNQAPEIMEERNPYTKEPYKNIFELRHVKNQWMLEELPKLVKNYIFIRYEDLVNDFEATMRKIRDKGLKQKDVTQDIQEMKKWMKARGDKDVDEKIFEFAQINPEKAVRGWMPNKPCDELKLKAEDYPNEYMKYEKFFGYL